MRRLEELPRRAERRLLAQVHKRGVFRYSGRLPQSMRDDRGGLILFETVDRLFDFLRCDQVERGTGLPAAEEAKAAVCLLR